MVSTTSCMAGDLPKAMDKVHEFIADVQKNGQKPVFFLDFDGTLAPIVSNPDDAELPPETRRVLTSLSQKYTTGIVTGRVAAKAKAFIGIDDLIYATSHGFNISIPKHPPFEMGLEHRPALEETIKELAPVVDATEGALMEDSTQSISVHYRHVAEGERTALRAAVDKACANHGVKLHFGKMVYEIRSPTPWHKGFAVEHILTKLRLNTAQYVPIYIGDDVTDEDAFGVLEKYGGTGVVVFDTTPKDGDVKPNRATKATLRLKDPYEVCDFLNVFVCAEQPKAKAVVGELPKEAQTQRAS